jgi:hypothetical protein
VASCATQKKPVAAAPMAPKTTSIADKIKSCKKKEGLFPLFQDTLTGNLFMIVKKEQLDKEFIYFSYTVDGVVAAGHFRGSFRDNKVFTIKRYFDKIEFVVQNTGYYFDKNNPISKAANANISNAILVNQKNVCIPKVLYLLAILKSILPSKAFMLLANFVLQPSRPNLEVNFVN